MCFVSEEDGERGDYARILNLLIAVNMPLAFVTILNENASLLPQKLTMKLNKQLVQFLVFLEICGRCCLVAKDIGISKLMTAL